MVTLVIDKKQRNLLLASEGTKEFRFLVKILNENEVVTSEMVRKMDSYKQVFFRDTLSKLLKQVQSEWVSKGDIIDLGNVSTECSICGTPNRYMHFIKNQYSGKSINLGSECAKKFFDDIKISRKNIKQAQKLRRLTEFFEIFPSADKMIDSWILDLNSLEYLLPNHIEMPYKNLCYRARSLMKEFQEEENNGELIVSEFKYVINEHGIFWDKILKYQQNRKGQNWAATKEVGEWLTRSQKIGVLALLKNEKNNCYIGSSTFADIWEPVYLKKIMPIINKKLNKISIISSEPDTNKFSLKASANFSVNVSQNISRVLAVLGPHIVGSNKSGLGKVDYDRILDGAFVSDISSMSRLLDALNKVYLRYRLHIAYFHVDFNEVILINMANERFKTYKLQDFLAKNMGSLVKYTKPSERSLVDEVLSSKDRWTQTKELNDILNDRLGTHQRWYPANKNEVIQLQG